MACGEVVISASSTLSSIYYLLTYSKRFYSFVLYLPLHRVQTVGSATQLCMLRSLIQRLDQTHDFQPLPCTSSLSTVNFLRSTSNMLTTLEIKGETLSYFFVWVLFRLSDWQHWPELDVVVPQWLQCGLWQQSSLIRRHLSGLPWLKWWACHQRCVHTGACMNAVTARSMTKLTSGGLCMEILKIHMQRGY